METTPLKLGKYKHYKGDIMEVIGVSLHSESLEEFATYRHITGDKKDEQHYWVRPIAMFLEDVEIEDKKVPRFEYMGE